MCVKCPSAAVVRPLQSLKYSMLMWPVGCKIPASRFSMLLDSILYFKKNRGKCSTHTCGVCHCLRRTLTGSHIIEKKNAMNVSSLSVNFGAKHCFVN